MARHFGTKMSGWQATGASREPSASSGKYAPRDSNIVLADRASSLREPRPDWSGFGRSAFFQAMIDIAAVVSIVVLACATGVGLAAAGFILLFIPL